MELGGFFRWSQVCCPPSDNDTFILGQRSNANRPEPTRAPNTPCLGGNHRHGEQSRYAGLMRAACLCTSWAEAGKRIWRSAIAASIGSIFALSGGVAQAQAFQFPPPSPTPRPIQPATQTPPAALSPQPAQSYPTPLPMESPPQTYISPHAGPAPASSTTNPTLPPSLVQPLPQAAPGAKIAAWPPGILPYRAGMPIPQGYRLDSHINSGLVYGGLAIWAAPYLTGLIAAAASGFTKESGWLALPIVGPFIAMGGRTIDCTVLGQPTTGGTGTNLNSVEDQCRKSAIKEARVVALLTVDGLLQTTGAIMAVAGLLSPSEYLLRNDVFPQDAKLSFDAGYYQGQLRLQARMQF